MACVYKNAQRHGLIPRTEESNPMKWVRCKTTNDYEPIILTPQQAFALVACFPLLERTLTLLAAATGLRISECLGLQWQDLDFLRQQIDVRPPARRNRARSRRQGQTGGLKGLRVRTTLDFYTHAISRDKLVAQKSGHGSDDEVESGELNYSEIGREIRACHRSGGACGNRNSG
jgi:hypothetical protein